MLFRSVDRAVDESGNQISVFGRRGARPLNLAESQALYLRKGQLYTVADGSGEPQAFNNADPAGRTLWRAWLAKVGNWFALPRAVQK